MGPVAPSGDSRPEPHAAHGMLRAFSRSLPILASVAAPAVAGAPATAGAAEMPSREDIPEDHPGHRHAAHPNLMGSKFGYISLFSPAEGQYEHMSLGYAGLFYERSVIHGWLEIELTVAAAAGAEELAMPVDLYLKKPFHPSPRVTPYVGAGPHLDVVLHPERTVLGGACVTVGSYIWFSMRWGIDIDLDYAVAANREVIIHDVLLAIGPTARF